MSDWGNGSQFRGHTWANKHRHGLVAKKKARSALPRVDRPIARARKAKAFGQQALSTQTTLDMFIIRFHFQ